MQIWFTCTKNSVGVDCWRQKMEMFASPKKLSCCSRRMQLSLQVLKIHETVVKTCTLKRKTEHANKNLDLTCIFIRFVRCASSIPPPPPPPPRLPPHFFREALRSVFGIKGRKTAAQLGRTNLFISSCYVAITMVRIKLSAYSTRFERMH